MTDNGLPKDPEGNDSFWCCVARASHSSTAHTEEYVAINLCHVCLCLTSPSLTCQLLPACRRYISPMPPNNIIHSRINKGNNSMNKGKMRCKRGKAAAARKAHIQWWISFFFFRPSTLLKCLLNICPFNVGAITEHDFRKQYKQDIAKEQE